ncbi:tyramine/octopamine receptor-like [Oppia nitens]|uniref:tyramine/octopamine receptor-like n=1 Tax=Oppia nitens TaxID=1686743 RepID=UPI0023DBA129|nr:tyramine/octopamine receptor-like [Oppia nitens]
MTIVWSAIGLLANHTDYYTNHQQQHQHQHQQQQYHQSYGQLLSVKNLILGPILTVIILTTVLGNILVIVSACVEKSLRTASNCLIFSLAVSDLLVGLLVMPMRLTIALFGYWPFQFRCDLALELNILSSQASVLNLMAIAIDRWIVVSRVHNPSPLLTARSRKRIIIMVIGVWVVPIVFVGLPLMGWRSVQWTSISNKQPRCSGYHAVGYRLLGMVITFYIPVPIIIVFYSLIYRIARISARNKRRHNGQQYRQQQQQHRHSQHHQHRQQDNNRNDQRLAIPLAIPETSCVTTDNSPEMMAMMVNNNTANNPDTAISAAVTAADVVVAAIKRPRQASVCGSTCSVRYPSFIRRGLRFYAERDRKVAKTLVIITGLFLLCWSPFVIVYTVYINRQSIPLTLNETIIWLGLLNSTINPFIYAYFVPTFRSTFGRILCQKPTNI